MGVYFTFKIRFGGAIMGHNDFLINFAREANSMKLSVEVDIDAVLLR